jgi:hypothetical protein
VNGRIRTQYTLGLVNVAMWLVALIALVFVIQRAPSARGLFVIIVSGMGASITLLSVLGKAR